MKKIIKYQSLSGIGHMHNDKKNLYSILAPDYKKAVYKILLLTGLLFFGLLSPYIVKASSSKVSTIEKVGSNAITKKHKKAEREERRMIRQVEDISSATMNLFAKEFPNAHHVSWTATDGFAEADFTNHGSKGVAFYDYDNGLVGTGKYISYEDLPAKSFAQIDKHYKDYTPEQVIYYDDNELNENNANVFGATLDKDSYYALMQNKDSHKEIVLQISQEGNVLFFSKLK